MATAPDPPLELLLASADDRTAVLDGGLPATALTAATAPREPKGVASQELPIPDRDPNLLEAQRWAIVAPTGPAGDRLLGAMDALIRHRRAEQGVDPLVFRVPPGLGLAEAVQFRDNEICPESRPEYERPRYLMLLGDLQQVSLELQHVLAHGGFVGRVAFDREADYGAYADKVLRWEHSQCELPRLLTYTVQDGTSATGAGYRHLVQPCADMAERWRSAGQLELSEALTVRYEEDGPDELLAAAAANEADVLLSLSHGVGAPRAGWKTPDLQRRRQGSLCLGLDSDPLTADTIADRPFLPGGMWFMVACFGAGTPKTSVYQPWLAALADRGGDAAAVRECLRSLPRDDEPPFLAALPRAALANPNGPLAVFGHIDLAWTFSFMDDGRASRASQIWNALRAMLSGSRAGVALDVLMDVYRDTNHRLTTAYQDRGEAALRGAPDPVDELKLARLWMRRNDLRGYVLLGDPAVHLPLTRARARVGDPIPPSIIDLKRPRDGAPATLLPMTVPPPEPRDGPARPVPQDSTGRPAAVDPPVPRDSQTARSTQPTLLPPEPPVPRDTSPGPASALSLARPEPPPTPVPRDTSPRPPAAPAAPVPRDTSPRPPAAPAAPVPQDTSPRPPAAPAAPVPRDTSPRPPVAPVPQASQPPPADAARRRERAVFALLRGDEAPKLVAARHGVDLDDLLDWLERYREVGRRALARDD